MRILVATDQWFPDVRGGVARVTAETSRRLALAGHDVTVLAPAHAGAPAEQTEGGITLLRRLPRGPVPESLADAFAAWRFGSRERDFDAVVAHQVTTALGLQRGAPSLPLTLVYHASVVRETRLRAAEQHGLRRNATCALAAGLRSAERTVVDRAAKLLVLSEYSRSLVRADHPEAAGRINLVRGGFDEILFAAPPSRHAARTRLGLGADELVLLAVRRLERGLGVEEVVRAFAALDGRPTLLIVGDGGLRTALEQLAGELGVADRTRIFRVQDDETLVSCYRAADIFVLPPAPHEGFGLVTVEALAAGTPVVAVRTGASPELLEPLDPRFLADSAAPAELAAAIQRVAALADDGMRARCHAYARTRFSWDVVMRGWEEALVPTAV